MRFKIFGFFSVILLVAAIGWADAWNKRTILTVKEAIQVPGAVLQPGTYVMKLVESLSDRHIVRITNEKEDEVITTILAIPNYRLKPTGDSQFEFWETPAGNPRAMRAWFYPGDNFGQEFAYPKGMSTKIATFTESNVPSTPAIEAAALPTAPVVSVNKSGTEKPLEARVYAAPAPEPTAAPEPAPAPLQADRPEMPATASSLPAFALAALLTLAAGFAIRFATNAR
jgi:hypothetical protein